MSVVPAEARAQIQDLLSAAPVEVRDVAQRFGLAVYQMPLATGVSGVLLRELAYKTPSGFAILVNHAEAYVRQRFTAAHEIGHFVLHRDRIGNRVEDNYLLRAEGMSSAMETEANKFAADLLMPRPLLNSPWQAPRPEKAMPSRPNLRIQLGIAFSGFGDCNGDPHWTCHLSRS